MLKCVGKRNSVMQKVKKQTLNNLIMSSKMKFRVSTTILCVLSMFLGGGDVWGQSDLTISNNDVESFYEEETDSYVYYTYCGVLVNTNSDIETETIFSESNGNSYFTLSGTHSENDYWYFEDDDENVGFFLYVVDDCDEIGVLREIDALSWVKYTRIQRGRHYYLKEVALDPQSMGTYCKDDYGKTFVFEIVYSVDSKAHVGSYQKDRYYFDFIGAPDITTTWTPEKTWFNKSFCYGDDICPEVTNGEYPFGETPSCQGNVFRASYYWIWREYDFNDYYKKPDGEFNGEYWCIDDVGEIDEYVGGSDDEVMFTPYVVFEYGGKKTSVLSTTAALYAQINYPIEAELEGSNDNNEIFICENDASNVNINVLFEKDDYTYKDLKWELSKKGLYGYTGVTTSSKEGDLNVLPLGDLAESDNGADMTYEYKLEITDLIELIDDGEPCTWTQLFTVTVLAQDEEITIKLPSNIEEICYGSSVEGITADIAKLTPSSENYSYLWLLNGDGVSNNGEYVSFTVSSEGTASLACPSLTDLEAGDYEITLSIKNHGCEKPATETFTIHKIPAISLSATVDNVEVTEICAGTEVTLEVTETSETGDELKYTWSGGELDKVEDGTYPTTSYEQTVTPTETTTYGVIATSQYGCESTEATTSVTVYPIPEVTISPANQEVCYGYDQIFTATASNYTGSNLTYTWYLDGNEVSGETSSSYKLENITAGHTVSVSVNDGKCPSDLTATGASTSVTVLDEITFTIDAPDTFCATDNETLTISFTDDNNVGLTYTVTPTGTTPTTGSVSGSSYSYTFGTINEKKTETFTYEVYATTAGGCKSETKQVSITVNYTPSFTVTENDEGKKMCGVEGNTYNVFTLGDTYTSDEYTIEPNNAPEGKLITTDNGLTYVVTFGEISSQTSTTNGTYTITATDKDTGCPVTKTVENVDVNYLVPITATADKTVCITPDEAIYNIHVTTSGSGYSYTVNQNVDDNPSSLTVPTVPTGSGSITTDSNGGCTIPITFSNVTTYGDITCTYTITGSADGCEVTDKVTIKFHYMPKFTKSTDNLFICTADTKDFSFSVTDEPSGGKYTYKVTASDGAPAGTPTTLVSDDGYTYTIPSTAYASAETGTYTYTITATESGYDCSIVDEVLVTVQSIPKFTLSTESSESNYLCLTPSSSVTVFTFDNYYPEDVNYPYSGEQDTNGASSILGSIPAISFNDNGDGTCDCKISFDDDVPAYGQYKLIYTVTGVTKSSELCEYSDYITVYVDMMPDFSASAIPQECVRQGVEVRAISVSGTYIDEYEFNADAVDGDYGYGPELTHYDAYYSKDDGNTYYNVFVGEFTNSGEATYTYNVTATDDNGCTIPHPVTVTITQSPEINVTPDPSLTVCGYAGNTYTITVSPVMKNGAVDSDYTYSIDFVTTSTIYGLEPGNYVLNSTTERTVEISEEAANSRSSETLGYTITETYLPGECSITKTVYVTINYMPDYTIAYPEEVCGTNGNSFTIIPQSGTGYTYTIVPSENYGTTDTYTDGVYTVKFGEITGDSPSELLYTITATNTTTNCTIVPSKTITIKVTNEPDIEVTAGEDVCEGDSYTVSVATDGEYRYTLQNTIGSATYDGGVFEELSNECTIKFTDNRSGQGGKATYEFTLTAEPYDGFGCDIKKTFEVTVYYKPQMTLKISPDAICKDSKDQFTVTITPPYNDVEYSYEWYYKGTIISTNASKNASAVCYYDVNESTEEGDAYVKISYGNGCSFTEQINFVVNEYPEVPTIVLDGEGTMCSADAQPVTIYVDGGAVDGVKYTWYAGGKEIDGEEGASITVNPTETTSYYVIASSAEGCSKPNKTSNTITITINPTPEVTIISPEEALTLCQNAGDSVIYEAECTVDNVTYNWYIGDELVEGVTGSSFTFNSADYEFTDNDNNITVSCEAVSSAGCPSNRAVNNNVVVYREMKAEDFIESMDPAGGTCVGYPIVLKLKEGDGYWVQIYYQPEGDSSRHMVENGVQSSIASNDGYVTIEEVALNTEYSLEGWYNSCFYDKLPIDIDVYEQPKIEVTGATTVCEDGTLELSVDYPTTKATFKWYKDTYNDDDYLITSGVVTEDLGDIGSRTTLTIYSVSSDDAGTYFVYLEEVKTGCNNYAEVTVSVTERPVVTLSSDMATTCFGRDVTFTPETKVGDDVITFGDGQLESYDYYLNDDEDPVASNVTKDSYTISGLKIGDYVYVKAHANNCESDASNVITIATLPEFSPLIETTATTVCQNTDVTITVSTDNSAHKIKYDDDTKEYGIEISTTTPDVTVETTSITLNDDGTVATVTVRLTATAGVVTEAYLVATVTTEYGCEETTKTPIELLISGLVITESDITIDTVCLGNPTSITASAIGASGSIEYQFVVDDVVLQGYSEKNAFEYTAETAGEHTLTVYVQDTAVDDCVTSASKTFTVNPIPYWGDNGTIVDEANSTMCDHETIDLTVTADAGYGLEIHFTVGEDDYEAVYSASGSNTSSNLPEEVSVSVSGSTDHVYTVTFDFDYSADIARSVYFVLVDGTTGCKSVTNATYNLVAHDRIVVKNSDGAVYDEDKDGNVNITLCENTETTVTVSSGDNTSYTIDPSGDGTVLSNGDGSYTFKAVNDSDTFEYTITGDQTGCSITIVTTTVAAPTAGNITVTYYEEATGGSEQLDEFEDLPTIVEGDDVISYICEGKTGQITASGASSYTLTVKRDGVDVTDQFTSSYGDGTSVEDFSQSFTLTYVGCDEDPSVPCDQDYNEYVFSYTLSIGDCAIPDTYTIRVYRSPYAQMTLSDDTGLTLEENDTMISGDLNINVDLLGETNIDNIEYEITVNDEVLTDEYGNELKGTIDPQNPSTTVFVECDDESMEVKVVVTVTNDLGCDYILSQTIEVLEGLAQPSIDAVGGVQYYCSDENGISIEVAVPQRGVTYRLLGNGTCNGVTCADQTCTSGTASRIQWNGVKVNNGGSDVFVTEDFSVFAFYEGHEDEGVYSVNIISVTEILTPEVREIDPQVTRNSCETDDWIKVLESQKDDNNEEHNVYYELGRYELGISVEDIDSGNYDYDNMNLPLKAGNGEDLNMFEVKYPYAKAGTYVVYAFRIFDGSRVCPVRMKGEYIIDVPEAQQFNVVNPGGNYGNYCEDDESGITIELDGSEEGAIYILYYSETGNVDDAVPLGVPENIDGVYVVEGTGGALEFGPVFDSGVYTVWALLNYCPMPMNGSVPVKRYELPEEFPVTVPNYGYYCSGEEEGLTITVEGYEEGKIYTLYREDGTRVYVYGSDESDDVDAGVGDSGEELPDGDAEDEPVENPWSDGEWIYFDNITEGTYYIVVSEPLVDGGCDITLDPVKIDMIEKPESPKIGITDKTDKSYPDLETDLTVCVDDYLNIQFSNTEAGVDYTLMFKANGSNEYVEYDETKTASGNQIFKLEWGSEDHPQLAISDDAGTYTVRATRTVEVTDVNGDPVYEGDGETVLTASCDFWYDDLEGSTVELTVVERPGTSGEEKFEQVDGATVENPCYGVDIVVNNAQVGFSYTLYLADEEGNILYPDSPVQGPVEVEEGQTEARFTDIRNNHGYYVITISNGYCEDKFDEVIIVESDKYVEDQKVVFDPDMCIGDEGGTVGLAGAEVGVTYVLYDADYNILSSHTATTDDVNGFTFKRMNGDEETDYEYRLVETGKYYVYGINPETGCDSQMDRDIDFTVNRLPLSFNFTNTVYYCSSVDSSTSDSGSTGGGSTGSGGYSEDPEEDPEDEGNTGSGDGSGSGDDNEGDDSGSTTESSTATDIYERDLDGNIVYEEVLDENVDPVLDENEEPLMQPKIKEELANDSEWPGIDRNMGVEYTEPVTEPEGDEGPDDINPTSIRPFKTIIDDDGNEKVELPLLQTEGPDVEYILYRKEGDDDNYVLREVERVTGDPDGGTIYFYVDLEDAVYVVSARNTKTGCTSSMEGETTVIGSQGIATLSESPFTVTTCGEEAVFILSEEVEATELVKDATYYIVSSDYEGELDDETPVVASQKYAEGGEISLDITSGSGTYNIWASYDDYECAAIVGELVVNQYDKFEITDNQTEVCGENVTITLENPQEGVTYVLERTTLNGYVASSDAEKESNDGTPITWKVGGDGEATFLLSIQGSEDQCNETIEITFLPKIATNEGSYEVVACSGDPIDLSEYIGTLTVNATYYVVTGEEFDIDNIVSSAKYYGDTEGLDLLIKDGGMYSIYAMYDNYVCQTYIGSLEYTQYAKPDLSDNSDRVCSGNITITMKGSDAGSTYEIVCTDGNGIIVEDTTPAEVVGTGDEITWKVYYPDENSKDVSTFTVYNRTAGCVIGTRTIDFTEQKTPPTGRFDVYVNGVAKGSYYLDDTDPIVVCKDAQIMLYAYVTSSVPVEDYDFYMNHVHIPGHPLETDLGDDPNLGEDNDMNPIYITTLEEHYIEGVLDYEFELSVNHKSGNCETEEIARVTFELENSGLMEGSLIAAESEFSYCSGEEGIKLGFKNPEKGVVYELYRVADVDGNPLEDGYELMEIEEVPSYASVPDVIWFESWTSTSSGGFGYAESGWYVVNVKPVSSDKCSAYSNFVQVIENPLPGTDGDNATVFYAQLGTYNETQPEYSEVFSTSLISGLVGGYIGVDSTRVDCMYQLYNADKDTLLGEPIIPQYDGQRIYFGPIQEAYDDDGNEIPGWGAGNYEVIATDINTGCYNSLGSIIIDQESLVTYDVYLFLNKNTYIVSEQLVPSPRDKGTANAHIGWPESVDVAWYPDDEDNEYGNLLDVDGSGYTTVEKNANLCFRLIPDSVDVEGNLIYANIHGDYGFDPNDGVTSTAEYPKGYNEEVASGRFVYVRPPSLYGQESVRYQIYNRDYSNNGRQSNISTIYILCGNEDVGDDINSVFLIPNAFSPNGDGYNDVFKILIPTNYEESSESSLEVFNRWGTLVYKSSGNQYGKDCDWWDGTSTTSNMVSLGKELPSGTYFYVYKITFIDDTDSKSQTRITRKMHGYIELRR